MSRGGRGAGRGGRGGFTPAPRVPYSNGDSVPTPATFTASAAALESTAPVTATATPGLSVPTWGSSVPKWGPSGNTAPVVAPAAVKEVEGASSEWGAATEHSTTATVGWGDEVPDEQTETNGNEDHEIERPETPLASAPIPVEVPVVAEDDGWGGEAEPVVSSGWGEEEIVEAPKPRSKIIAPGSKMSWAQIAR
jgi:hypothetical protein